MTPWHHQEIESDGHNNTSSQPHQQMEYFGITILSLAGGRSSLPLMSRLRCPADRTCATRCSSGTCRRTEHNTNTQKSERERQKKRLIGQNRVRARSPLFVYLPHNRNRRYKLVLAQVRNAHTNKKSGGCRDKTQKMKLTAPTIKQVLAVPTIRR